MLGILRLRPLRTLHASLILLGSLLVGSCSEGKDPASVLEDAHLLVTVSPAGLEDLAPEGTGSIEGIRLTVEEFGTGTFLGRQTFDVYSQAQEWTLDFSLAISPGSEVSISLSVELLSFDGGVETVEWSGRVSPVTLQVGSPTVVQEVPLVRGPLGNLGVTGVAIQEPAPSLREGQDAQLTATASTTTPASQPTIFWGSLNPAVAVVSGTGLVQTSTPGLAGIVATAGVVADTVTVTVLPRPASVALEPTDMVLDALGEDALFQATILDPRGDPVPEDEATWSVGDPEILQSLGNGAFRSVSRGTTSVVAASTIDPSVTRSTDVVVRQVVTAVEVIPEEAVVFVGEGAEFRAVALDANENPIEGMGFSWSTPDADLASVDGEGLATGLEAGTASILAEAASEVMEVGSYGSLAPTAGTTGVGTLEVLPEVARVAVLPNPFTFRSLGQTQAFTARAYGLDQAGAPTILLPVTDFTWASLNQTVVRVDSVGSTADTAFVSSVASGSTVLRATARGVTGSTPVFVAPAGADVQITLNPRTLVGSARDFGARGYDAPGRLVAGIASSGAANNGKCFPNGTSAGTQTTSAHCGFQWSSEIDASTGGVTQKTVFPKPSAEGRLLGRLAPALPAGSPFRLSGFQF
ncbi:MAG: Ig-like domain-containing protein [Longimicrobiales bacterium]